MNDNTEQTTQEYIVEIISRSQQSFSTKSTDGRHAMLKTVAYMFRNGLLDPKREEIVSFLVKDTEDNIYLQAPTVGIDTDVSEYEVMDLINRLDRRIDVDTLRDFEEDTDF